MATYYDLYIQCPACIADNGFDPKPPAQWYHANCGGTIQVGDNAYYKCSCGHSAHIKNWQYACTAHEGDYRFANSGAVANAISVAGQVTNLAGRQWLLNLITNLGDW